MQHIKQSQTTREFHHSSKRRRSSDTIAVDISAYIEAIKILKARSPSSEEFYSLAGKLTKQLKTIRERGVAVEKFDKVQRELNDKIAELSSFVEVESYHVTSHSLVGGDEMKSETKADKRRKQSPEEVIQVDISGYIDAIKVLKDRRPSVEAFYDVAEAMIDDLLQVREHGVPESKYEMVQLYLKEQFARLTELSKQTEDLE